jgi:hypothetical protein
MRSAVLALALATGWLVANSNSAAAAIVDVPVDGTWIVRTVVADPPVFYPDTYVFTCGPEGCVFDISGNRAISPTYEVFDFGVSLGTTPSVPGWQDLGCASWFTPSCRITDPDDAWADPRYSKLSLLLAGGDHEVTIKVLTFALNKNGGPLPDGPVQFRVRPVPLPAALPLFAAGVAVVAFAAGRRKV